MNLCISTPTKYFVKRKFYTRSIRVLTTKSCLSWKIDKVVTAREPNQLVVSVQGVKESFSYAKRFWYPRKNCGGFGLMLK